jgi:hypothetical protein
MNWKTIPPYTYHLWLDKFGYVAFQPCMRGKFRALLPKSNGYSLGRHVDCDTLDEAKYLVERNNVVWC